MVLPRCQKCSLVSGDIVQDERQTRERTAARLRLVTTSHFHSQSSTTPQSPFVQPWLQLHTMTATLLPRRKVNQPGLEWVEDVFSIEPCWTEEPSIETITRLTRDNLKLSEAEQVTVKAFAEGAFNKLFSIDCAKGRFIFRVSLPVAPVVKTSSEVATLAFIREKTDIPVPHVIAHDADLSNELGFEWMLMERVDARPLHEVWHGMSWMKKGLLVKQIAEHVAQLFNIELSGIGSLGPADKFAANADGQSTHTVGEIVQPAFFKGDNIALDIARGPFRSTHEYLTARLQLLEHFASKLDQEDEDDLEHYSDIQAVLSSLRIVVPRLFPDNSSSTAEPTILCNRDISTSNILVNPQGDLISIVDWECVATLPPYFAVQLPQFLKGPSRTTPPAFTSDTASEVHKTELELYETTCLRKFFLEEMARICPAWLRVFETEKVRADVLVALDKCENDMTVKWVRAWLDAVVEGREPRVSLTDACRNPLGAA